MGKTIVICNQKGGVGKTTSTINIATQIALHGKKTLIIDIDPQANATSGLGIDKNKVEYSVYSALLESATLQNALTPTHIENLDMIASNPQLIGAEIELVDQPLREFKLKEALEPVKNNYEFIFIDCPPSLGLLTVNALVSADSVIIPIQCEYYALEGLTQLIDTINLIRDRLNNSLHIQGIILTMADYRARLTKEVINEVKGFFSDKNRLENTHLRNVRVYDTIISRSVRLSEAPSFGRPIALYAKNSSAAKQYEDLTNEILSAMHPGCNRRDLAIYYDDTIKLHNTF